jgi:hypothetical protein
MLCAALDRVQQSPPENKAAREFLAAEAANIVLANVAAHAAEALIEQPKIRRTRRAGFPSRGKKRRFDLGSQSQQRRLFVVECGTS